jgi:hypothetical protein
MQLGSGLIATRGGGCDGEFSASSRCWLRSSLFTDYWFGFAGIFRYIVKLSKEKIEVSPAKSNPNSNEHIE